MSEEELEALTPAYQAYTSLQNKADSLVHYSELLGDEDPSHAILLALGESLHSDLQVLFRHVFKSDSSDKQIAA